MWLIKCTQIGSPNNHRHMSPAGGTTQTSLLLPQSGLVTLAGAAFFQAHAEKQQQAQGEDRADPSSSGRHPQALQCRPGRSGEDGHQGGKRQQAGPPQGSTQRTGCAGGGCETATVAGTGNVVRNPATCSFQLCGRRKAWGPQKVDHTFNFREFFPFFLSVRACLVASHSASSY